MKIIAYVYSDPLLEPIPDPEIWGWEVDRIYQDLGMRDATLKEIAFPRGKTAQQQKRPQLQQLVSDCQQEPVEYVLVRRLEELGDSVQEVSDRLAQLEDLSVQLVVLETAVGDAHQTPLKRSDLLKVLEEVQRSQRSRSIRQGHARNRIKALPPPGKAPFGYRRGKDRYALDRSQAPIVKDFFERFLLYGSLHGAVRYLEKKHGKKISVSTGQRWLNNPVYRGDLAYKSGEVISNTHVPIVSREEAAQVDRLLRRNRRLPPRTASAPRSLAGLVVCAECQSNLTITRVTARRSDQEYLYLRPIACPRKPKCRAIPYEQILERTIQNICQELPQAVAQLNMPNIGGVQSSIEQAIATKQTVLDQLPELVEQEILDTETAELRAYKLRTEMSQLQNQLAQLPPPNLPAIAQAVSIPEFWLDLSESERRFYFREFIRQIQLIRHEKSWKLELTFIF